VYLNVVLSFPRVKQANDTQTQQTGVRLDAVCYVRDVILSKKGTFPRTETKLCHHLLPLMSFPVKKEVHLIVLMCTCSVQYFTRVFP